MIRIDRERYRKHTIIDLERLNKPFSTDFLVLGNYSCDSDFGNFSLHMFDIPSAQKSKMIFQIDLLVDAEEIILC
jgi:hypothetical protein